MAGARAPVLVACLWLVLRARHKAVRQELGFALLVRHLAGGACLGVPAPAWPSGCQQAGPAVLLGVAALPACLADRRPALRALLQWRMMLPHSLPAFRRATAAFLDFVASPGAQPLSCAPVSTPERAAARADGAADGANGSSSAAAFALGKGWFGAVAAGASVGGDSPAAGRAGGYAWQLAERLYSGAQYALAFQLALAPEVGEEELAELGPEWVRPATLLALQVGWMRRLSAGGRALGRAGAGWLQGEARVPRGHAWGPGLVR